MGNYGKRGSFLGFTYNGIHSSTLGLTRVSSNKRYEDNLIPTLKDVTTSIVGADGVVYFGTTYTKRDISVSFAFDGVTNEWFRLMHDWLNGKEIHDLIFDEYPYKIYSAKIVGQSLVKHLKFGEGENEVFKGEGTIKFQCFFPFARSRYLWQEDYNLDNIPEWRADADFYTNWTPVQTGGNVYYDFETEQQARGALVGDEDQFVWVNPQSLLIDTTDTTDPTCNGKVILNYYEDSPYINYDEWIDSSKIPSSANYGQYDEDEQTIVLYNAGDVEMPTQWLFTVSETPIDIGITCGEDYLIIENLQRSHIVSPTGAGGDKYIMIDMPTHVIQGYDSYMRPTGRVYNRYITMGDFFGIPLGEHAIGCSRKPVQINYYYLYL